MFNLFRDFDQELTQSAKLQHLFQKINCDGLSNCIAALESQHNNTRFSQVLSSGSSFDRFNSKHSRGHGRGGNSRGRGSQVRGSSVHGRG